MDTFREKRIRRALDELAHLHQLPSLGQIPPGFLNVRVYVLEGESIQCDLARIRQDVAAKKPNQDVAFDLRVIAIAPNGSRATTYLIPSIHLQELLQLNKTISELAPLAVAAPSDLDLNALARDLAKRGTTIAP
jgi:hypothetical protein